MTLDLKWVSCRYHIYGSGLCIHSANLHLLIGTFNPCTFKVIIDMNLLSFLLTFLNYFHSSFLLLFTCELMTIFRIRYLYIPIRYFSLFLCVSIIHFWFVVTMRLIYNKNFSLCIHVYMCVCLFLNLLFLLRYS